MPSSSSRRLRSGKGIVEEEEPSAEEEEEEAPDLEKETAVAGSRRGKKQKQKATETPEPSGSGKRQKHKAGKSSSRRLKLKSPSSDGEERICFVCFEGGDLVHCNHAGCPKVYHPACTDHDEAFFKSTDEWSCSWHTCRTCVKAAQFMCYTCTHSLCKSCVKKAGFFCVRGDRGFCENCRKLVMSIENSAHENKEKAKVDLDDENSWEYLFKCYWLDLKGKLSFTLGELTRARNPWKESDVSTRNGKSSDALHDACDGLGSSADGPSGHIGASNSNGSKMKKRFRFANEKSNGKEAFGCEGMSVPEEIEWASKELMEFVSRMKDGNQSVSSQADVLLLLLEYIKRNNLRDPQKRSQVICDPVLMSLFGKAHVRHAEMLKLLDSHFIIKENNDVTRWEDDRDDDAVTRMTSSKKRRTNKRIEARRPQTNLDEYAAIDVHNVSLIYLRRSLMEDLIDDMEMFHDRVVGSFVRIRISGMGPKQEKHQLVQIVGTSSAEEMYTTGKKTTDLMLEILNLDSTDFVSIDTISDQDLTEDECNRLCQDIKSGLISRLTVGEVLEKAMDLQAVRVNNWLETELLLLSRIRDRANEKGRRKEESLDKIQLLSMPEERSRRLEELPEVYADPSMDPGFELRKDQGDQDSKASGYKNLSKGKELASTGKGGSASTNISQTDKIWHYKDPSGKTQGPFSLAKFHKWSKGGYFPADLRIWKASEGQEDSVLLTDALDENPEMDPLQHDPFQSLSQPESKQDDKEGGWGGTSSSTWTDKQQCDEGKKSNWDSASGPDKGNAGGWGTQSSGWAAEKTEAVSSKGGWGASSSGVWESNDSNARSCHPQDDISKPTPSFSEPVPDQPAEANWTLDEGCGSGHGNASAGWGKVTQEKTNAGWGSAMQGPSTNAITKTGWETSKQEDATISSGTAHLETSPKGNTGTGWGAAEGNANTGWGTAIQETLTQGKMNTGWGAATQGNTNKIPGEAAEEASTEGNTNAGWGKATESITNTGLEAPKEGKMSMGWESTTQGKKDKGSGAAPWGTSTQNDKSTERTSTQDTNTDGGMPECETSKQGKTNTGWQTPTEGKANMGSATAAWGTPERVTSTSTGPGTDAWGTSAQGETTTGRRPSAEHNAKTGLEATAWQTSTQRKTNTVLGTESHGNANMGSGTSTWETSTKGNAKAGWESAQGDTNTGSGKASWGSMAQGDTNTGSGKAAWGSTAQGETNVGWGTPIQGNTKTGSGTTAWETPRQGKTNTGWGTESEGNANTGSGTAAWETPTQGNTKTRWGSAAQGNTSGGWGTAGQGNANAGWGMATEENTDGGWKASAGSSGAWGSSQKHTGGKFSGGEGDRGHRDSDSWRGGEKPSWNRQSSGGEGNSSRMPPRGGQRVCKFHESGHCKKGTSCNFLHA